MRLVLDVGEPLVQPGALPLATELDLFDLAESGKNLISDCYNNIEFCMVNGQVYHGLFHGYQVDYVDVAANHCFHLYETNLSR